MNTDPFYRQILERLSEPPRDPHRFEACVCDLLREAYPCLVLVSGRGGADGGMDGAIADGEGEAYPLVVTTQEDLRENLTTSLESQLRHGQTRRQVVLATSREVNPAYRLKLQEAARAKGFTLEQIYDRHEIAARLRRSPRWCRDLLGLSGALSTVPPTRRLPVDIQRVGRDEDLAWLRDTSGDRLLVGEPGSGKTFLLAQLVEEDRGFFLDSDDWTEIASWIAEVEPAAVLVDDAHIDPDRLTRLHHLRTQHSLPFEIVASAWKGARDRVAEALGGLAASQIQTLEGLTRNEIVEIYRRWGVDIPDEGLRELVDQAANNPGLAVTLAQAFLRGEYEALIRGEALGQAVTTPLDRLIGKEATPLLAAFALGGDSGMTVDAVGEALDLAPLEVRRIASDLAASGVLGETGGSALAVRPPQLRAHLIAKAFFSATPSLDLPWRRFADLAPSRDDVAHTLILAADRGARVPESILREETSRSTSKRVWRSLAHLSQPHAEWVLDSYPGDLADVLDAVLDQAPEAALPRLLATTEQGTRSGWPAADRLEPLYAWISEIPPGNDVAQAMRRRVIAVQAAKAHLSAGGDAEVGVQALCAALSPRVGATSRDPGMGDRITLTLGAELRPSTIPEFHRLWDSAKDALPPISGPAWRELRELLREWSEPAVADRGKPEVRRTRQEFVAQILRDLAVRSAGNPGLNSELQKAADRLDALDLDLGLPRDPVFELLFDDDALATDAQKAVREAEMADLAARWSLRDPAETLAAFAMLEAEAREYRSHLNFWQVRRFGALLAAAVDRPEAWLAAALDAEQGFALSGAFLRRTVELRRPGWEDAVQQSLALERTEYPATEVVLQMEDPPEHLLSTALDKAATFPQLVETVVASRRTPPMTLLRLLDHSDKRVAARAAIGEWLAQNTGRVRSELQTSWRGAILQAQTSECKGAPRDGSVDYWLSAILSSDSDLALSWLRARLDEPESLPGYLLVEETSSHSPFAIAIRALSPAQKLELLAGLRPLPRANHFFLEDLLTLVIGRDAALYEELLQRKDLAAYSLAPLRGRPDAAWAGLAELALQHGASAAAIVEAAISVPRWIAGSGVEYWQAWKAAFEALQSDARPGIREIGRLGCERAQQFVHKADADWREQQRRGF